MSGRDQGRWLVGRKSRRAEDASNILRQIAPDLSRAVGEGSSPVLTAPRPDTLDEATRTHGSNPARHTRFKMDYPRRAEIFALPTATSRRSAADVDAQASYRLS